MGLVDQSTFLRYELTFDISVCFSFIVQLLLKINGFMQTIIHISFNRGQVLQSWEKMYFEA